MIDIYYVEDDENIAQAVKEYLEQRECKVTILMTVANARQALRIHIPTIVLVDWNMPDGLGSELCRWIRRRWSNLPVIFLTVRGDSHDIVSGFQDGADDYVVKLFELEVLCSRIRALLRRVERINETSLFCDNLLLDKEKMTVFCEQKEIILSKPEYQLILTMMENKGKTVTMKRLREKYRIPWIVFDRDQVQGFDEIIAEAVRGIQVGWSNPCFEIWMYAYFGVMPAIRDSWTCCSDFGRVYETKTGQKYSKADEQMYGKLCKFGDEEKAIQIAQQKLEQCKREGKTKPSEMCPCTTVHELVGEIKSKVNL